MENLTHSLFGATLAELALPVDASPAQRRLFLTVGIVAANLPDADLLYSSIMPPPMGYLLHHRGHTHTFVGLIAQGALIGGVLLVPKIRALVRGISLRFWTLLALALMSHVVLDSWNVYGVHPFWPFDNGWYYGDAVSIFEPWLWIILGLAAAANTRNDIARRALFALPIVLVCLAAALGAVQRASAVLLLVAAALMWIVGRGLDPLRRSAAALAASAVFVVLSLLLSSAAKTRVANAAALPLSEQVLDIAVSPHPGQPLCWSTWVIHRSRIGDRYSVMRGDVSVAPAILSPLGCESADVVLASKESHSVKALQDLVDRDCWARTWMQFARFPWLEGNEVEDERFHGDRGPGFTAMEVVPAGRACPAHATSWGQPRADLLQ